MAKLVTFAKPHMGCGDELLIIKVGVELLITKVVLVTPAKPHMGCGARARRMTGVWMNALPELDADERRLRARRSGWPPETDADDEPGSGRLGGGRGGQM